LSTQRARRVAEQIQQEISSLLLKGLRDPRIGFATLTHVDVTSDLGLARIYFTVIGDETVRKNTEKGLKSSVPYLRREIASRLQLRHAPDLLFVFDTSLEYGQRIESIIEQIHGGKQADDRSDTEEH
jgi:ribosome-binding factor A